MQKQIRKLPKRFANCELRTANSNPVRDICNLSYIKNMNFYEKRILHLRSKTFENISYKRFCKAVACIFCDQNLIKGWRFNKEIMKLSVWLEL